MFRIFIHENQSIFGKWLEPIVIKGYVFNTHIKLRKYLKGLISHIRFTVKIPSCMCCSCKSNVLSHKVFEYRSSKHFLVATPTSSACRKWTWSNKEKREREAEVEAERKPKVNEKLSGFLFLCKFLTNWIAFICRFICSSFVQVLCQYLLKIQSAVARFFVYSSMLEARNKIFFCVVKKYNELSKGCSSVLLSPSPFSLSLLPSLSPSFKLKETFWTYSSCGLIHRTRLHGPRALSGKG